MDCFIRKHLYAENFFYIWAIQWPGVDLHLSLRGQLVFAMNARCQRYSPLKLVNCSHLASQGATGLGRDTKNLSVCI